jgi:hypothetical protein
MWQMLRHKCGNPSNKRSILATAPAEKYRGCPDYLCISRKHLEGLAKEVKLQAHEDQ